MRKGKADPQIVEGNYVILFTAFLCQAITKFDFRKQVRYNLSDGKSLLYYMVMM